VSTTDQPAYGSLSGDFDPFEAKDRVFGAGAMLDPYPRLAELRSECPVHAGSISARFGMIGSDTMLFPEERQWSVYSYDGVEDVLKDPATFSSDWYQASLTHIIGRTILEMDPPEHHRYRMLLQGAFSKKSMDRWERDFVRDIVDRQIDRFARLGHCDLVADFAFDLPITVTAVAAGLPLEGLDAFYRDAVLLTNVAVSEEQRLAAAADLREVILAMIAERRAEPRDDLVSVLVQAELREGDISQRLTDEEIVALMRLLIPAGAQTTYRALTTLLYALLTHPDQLAALVADRSLIPAAIEEGLRWEVPLTATGRRCTHAVEIAGVEVAEGASVNVAIAAANHDNDRWERPEEFDIFREPQPHVAFGVGPHICLGIHLARMEMRVALELLLARLSGLRLAPDAGEVRISGLGYRTANRLPVVFEPER
jgi:cytochrome P450